MHTSPTAPSPPHRGGDGAGDSVHVVAAATPSRDQYWDRTVYTLTVYAEYI
eukprot:GDKH01003907.1.p5 GENE.GDKH01003907.1~~GDKH01003907.1.p5  ORF type:complete len:51 (+),score=0.65 GDKH01003907.1:84-236(+)